jgi:DNA repair exonuclease SbcCD ATPase subunit
LKQLLTRIVGDSSRLETAITVTGLKPDHLYNIRVVAANAHNFQAPSRLIRLRTEGRKRPRAGSTAGASILGDDHDLSGSPGGESGDESPGILAHGTYLEPPLQSPLTPGTNREHNGHNQGQRHRLNKKTSLANTAIEPVSQQNYTSQADHIKDQDDSNETIQHLTEILEIFRRETVEVETQLSQAEEEYEATRAGLIDERDRLRHAHKEKEDTSAELRKEVASLDRANRSAQSKKSAKEKQLHQKQGERQKMERDTLRWQDEIAEIQEQLDRLEKEKAGAAECTEKRIQEIQQECLTRQQSVKTVEEDVRLKGIQIKELEEERRKLRGGEDDEAGRERERQEKEKDMQWDQRNRQLLEKYKAEWNVLQQVCFKVSH